MYGLIEQILFIKGELLSSGGILNTFILIACSLGLITSAIYIFANTAEAQMTGQGINTWSFLRPLVVGFCISIFPLIIDILDGLSTATSKIISQATNDFRDETRAIRKELRQAEAASYNDFMSKVPGYEDNNTEITEKSEKGLGMVVSIAGAGTEATDIIETDTQTRNEALSTLWSKVDSALRKANDAIGGVFYDICNSVNIFSARIISNLIYSIAKIAAPIIKALATIYLVILALIGPIVFAIGIAPSLTSSITSWLSRYIQISLWLPLSDLVMYIIRSMELTVLKAHQGMNTGGIIYYPDDAMCIISLICIVAIFKVPTIASWIISSAGAGGMTSSISRAGAAIGKLITKV